MKPLPNLSDAEIDALLLLLFNGPGNNVSLPLTKSQSMQELSHDDLLRIRSQNHPDKFPHVNQAAYQAAVEELDRRRKAATHKKSVD